MDDPWLQATARDPRVPDVQRLLASLYSSALCCRVIQLELTCRIYQVGPQTKEIVEPPRDLSDMEDNSTETKTEVPEDQTCEQPSRRSDLASRLMASRPMSSMSSPDMTLELKGALNARSQSQRASLAAGSPPLRRPRTSSAGGR